MADQLMADGSRTTTLRRALRFSITEGAFAQVFNSLAAAGSVFLTKFLILLGGGPFHFSVLAAIGQLSQVAQPAGVVLSRNRSSRKGLVVWLTLAARSFPLLFLALPFALQGEWAIWVFLGLFLVASTVQAVALNVWTVWIADLFPVRIRGRFLSNRTLFLMVTGLATGYAFSFFLDSFAAEEPPPWLARWTGSAEFFTAANLPSAFAVVFSVAVVAGLAGVIFLARQPERVQPAVRETLTRAFVTPLKDGNFRRLLFYGSWWMLAIGIGAPFWQPFMLQDLKMSMTQIQIYGTLSVVASLLFLRWWGRIIDAFGNRTAMRIVLTVGGANALAWVFATPERLWIVYAEGATSGFMWSGAGIVGANFVLSVSPRDRVQVYAGLFAAFSGLSMMATMLISGALMPSSMQLGSLHLAPAQVLFALTGIARWSTHIPLSFIREPRARPVGQLMWFLWRGAKLRIAQGLLYFRRHGDGTSGGGGEPRG